MMMMSDQVRRSRLVVTYDGVDITADVSPYIIGFAFTERARHGESDELSIAFQNVDQLWNNGWWPERGASVSAKLEVENWYQPGDAYRIDCGTFEIDDLTDSGPPSVFVIGALSVGITSSIRGEEVTRAWENIKLSEIVGQLAKKHGFKVYFDSEYDPIFDRFDQKKQSDLAFILKIAEYAGLQVRLSHGKLIVYQDSLYDQQEIALTITKNYDGYLGHHFRASSSDIFTACHVMYLDSKTRKLLTYQYSPEGRSGTLEKTSVSSTGATTAQMIDQKTRMLIPAKTVAGKKEEDDSISLPNVGKVLKIHRRCSSLAEAEKLAKSSLRNKNRRELSGTLDLMGNPALRAGMVIAVNGFGRWDTARYAIEEVTHNWSKGQGLITQAGIRGIMGY
ncbi:phage late control D family protein [Klebsiella oxytoca]|uniref:phage late control D family protein n=1 Tax=Klebsiella oxytoca TaxID=571 RepID=UPI002245AC71|nr:hypothetical protein [Klebsiella oxytoca]MCW9548009.1 hypothetical protein [Klebsiella oxytoca]